MASEDSSRQKCPHCNATYLYRASAIDDRGYISCQNCGKPFVAYLRFTGAGLELDPGPSVGYAPPASRIVTTEEAVRVRCPYCGAKYLYRKEHATQDGMYKCQNCGKPIESTGERVVIQKSVDSTGMQTATGVLVIAALLIFLFVPPLFSVPVILCMVASWALTQAGASQEDRVAVEKDDQGLSLD